MQYLSKLHVEKMVCDSDSSAILFLSGFARDKHGPVEHEARVQFLWRIQRFFSTIPRGMYFIKGLFGTASPATS